ncbi:Phosphoserine phosphatase [hydrothermal vent metagenome]|uniref:phosphoserine phosphatase n=1 Tax=hydrothermal vent metagenome TaxID=652676 RepID=A0A3B0VXZ2_9ZZZZ
MTTILIHSHTLSTQQQALIQQTLAKPIQEAQHFRVNVTERPSLETLSELSQKTQLDINLLPEHFKPEEIKLVISDMDSTLISIECIDEIADFIHVKAEVSAITEAAMRGELDFEESLIQRVKLLTGLDTAALQHVFDERLTLNPGAETWIQGLKANGISFALVSGGFTFFTERLKTQLNLDYTRANTLGESDGKLTGKVVGDIIGAQAKANFLHELCQTLNIQPHQIIAVGDGANDLLMMKEAGLSIAYHAKPAVQKEALTALNHRGLDAILDFLA